MSKQEEECPDLRWVNSTDYHQLSYMEEARNGTDTVDY